MKVKLAVAFAVLLFATLARADGHPHHCGRDGHQLRVLFRLPESPAD